MCLLITFGINQTDVTKPRIAHFFNMLSARRGCYFLFVPSCASVAACCEIPNAILGEKKAKAA